MAVATYCYYEKVRRTRQFFLFVLLWSEVTSYSFAADHKLAKEIQSFS